MTVAAARRASLGVLADIRRRGAFSRPVIDAALARSGLSREDAGFAARLVYSVISAEGVLDAVIDECATRPGAVEPRVRDVLRMSICELLYLRTPVRAAVHQGVDAVRHVRPAATGFANAVLRRVSERAATFPWGDPASDRDALERAAAMPGWLVERFIDDLGESAGREALLTGMEPAPLYVRTNPFLATPQEAFDRLVADGAQPEASSPDAFCFRCGSPREAVRSGAINAGLVIVSDAAAQVAPLACSPVAGARVLDVAAGRGTKTAILQGIALGTGGPALVTAADTHGFKLTALEGSLSALGIPAAITATLDATDSEVLTALGGDFDVVLVDAPCSGLGTLRRHPEKRWRVAPEDIDRMAVLQQSLLEAASHVVRCGGLVVYSTCTITRTENQDVVSRFLAGEKGRAFSTKPLAGVVDDAWHRFITPEGWFRSWPESGGADGHFVAALVRAAT